MWVVVWACLLFVLLWPCARVQHEVLHWREGCRVASGVVDCPCHLCVRCKYCLHCLLLMDSVARDWCAVMVLLQCSGVMLLSMTNGGVGSNLSCCALMWVWLLQFWMLGELPSWCMRTVDNFAWRPVVVWGVMGSLLSCMVCCWVVIIVKMLLGYGCGIKLRGWKYSMQQLHTIGVKQSVMSVVVTSCSW